MANARDPHAQRDTIHLLAEGNSIRSIERLANVHRDTVMRLPVRVGNECRAFLDGRLRGLRLRHVQADGIWTFVGKKQARLGPGDAHDSAVGGRALYVAFDQDTKLIATYALGERTSEVTAALMPDLAGRVVTQAPRLSTDGFNACPAAVRQAFGDDVACGTLIKDFAEPQQPGRHGPPEMAGSSGRQLIGLDDIDLRSICTSHAERNNLTIRAFVRRFTRLSLGFSNTLSG